MFIYKYKMYDTTFKCTYQLLEKYNNFIEGNECKDNDNEIKDAHDVEGLSDDLYRSQFLQALQLTKWNEIIINEKLEFLQKTLENDNMGKVILETMKEYSKIPIENIEIMLLCAYDYFYLFHNCIIELINNKCISENSFHLLINKIKQV